MAPFIADSAKGRWVEKFMLPIGGDNIIVVLLQSSGLQADATLNNYTFLSQLLAAGNTEATFTNYTRKVLAAADITVSVNTGTGVTTVDTVDQVWNAAGGALNNTLGALLTCYRPTSGSLDSAVLVLTKHDFAATTTGGNLTAQVPSIGTAT
jgi:hypothetical protein